jgi:Ser-tRNA(Ala) deacylase AlaX
MVKKIFWKDPYLTELQTRVRNVSGAHITLEETIFYAFSGGQESDHGTIEGHRVLEACKEGKEITYTLQPDHALQPGDSVRVEIDWERRYRLMRLHFAAELVLELVNRNLSSPPKIGAHIAQDKARIDFEFDRSVASALPGIRSQALAIIQSNQSIISAYFDEADERRYWEIPGFTRVPCGGTHLKRTGEVGGLELKRKNIGKGKERVEIYVTSG